MQYLEWSKYLTEKYSTRLMSPLMKTHSPEYSDDELADGKNLPGNIIDSNYSHESDIFQFNPEDTGLEPENTDIHPRTSNQAPPVRKKNQKTKDTDYYRRKKLKNRGTYRQNCNQHVAGAVRRWSFKVNYRQCEITEGSNTQRTKVLGRRKTWSQLMESSPAKNIFSSNIDLKVNATRPE